MPGETLAAVLQQLLRLNVRLSLGPQDSLDVIADDGLLVHLEQRRFGAAPQALTPAMHHDRLMSLLDAMDLALDLDRRLPPSLAMFSRPAPALPRGPERPAPGWPQEPR